MTIAAQKLKVLLTVVMGDRDLVINVKSCGGVQALCAPAPEQLLEAKPDDIVLVAGHVPGDGLVMVDLELRDDAVGRPDLLYSRKVSIGAMLLC